MIMMLWEIRSWLKKRDRDCRKTVETFSYDYDALNRLTSVACNGKTLRTYGYDAFGNRNTRTEYQTAGELVTTLSLQYKESVDAGNKCKRNQEL